MFVFSVSKTTSVPKKCTECRQFLDSSDLKLFPGDPDEAVNINLYFLLFVLKSIVLSLI